MADHAEVECAQKREDRMRVQLAAAEARVRELEAELAVLRTEHAKLKARVVNSLENPTTVEGLRAAALEALRG